MAGLLTKLGFRRRNQKIPILGIQGVGKSYFINTLALFLSYRKMGEVVGAASADYLYRLTPSLLKGHPLDATSGYRDVELEVHRVYFENYLQAIENPRDLDYGEDEEKRTAITRECHFVLSTSDMSGLEFAQAMQLLSEPLKNIEGNPMIQRFLRVIEDCDGMTVMIDLVRKIITPEEFQENKRELIKAALAEQMLPLLRGIELAVKDKKKGKNRIPLFLVFTKSDIHQMGRKELRKMIIDVFPIALARLDDYLHIRIHATQSIGFGEDKNTDNFLDKASRGIGLYLADVYNFVEDK